MPTLLFQIFVAYFAIVNVVAFVMFGIDKRRARKARPRISERTLLLVALIGGAAGAWAGMYVFRHKTLHRKFTVIVPLLTVGWLAFVLSMVFKL